MSKIIQLLLKEIEDNPQVFEELVTALMSLFVAKPALLQQAVQVAINKVDKSTLPPVV